MMGIAHCTTKLSHPTHINITIKSVLFWFYCTGAPSRTSWKWKRTHKQTSAPGWDDWQAWPSWMEIERMKVRVSHTQSEWRPRGECWGAQPGLSITVMRAAEDRREFTTELNRRMFNCINYYRLVWFYSANNECKAALISDFINQF